jgi:hypothetical protein
MLIFNARTETYIYLGPPLRKYFIDMVQPKKDKKVLYNLLTLLINLLSLIQIGWK